MLASNRMTATITFFLRWVRDASLLVQPMVIMTNCDQAQINVLGAIYPWSTVNLCTWHVLCAMRSHFNTNKYLVLWNKVKSWVKTTDQIEFAMLWVEISNDPSAPQSFMKEIRRSSVLMESTDHSAYKTGGLIYSRYELQLAKSRYTGPMQECRRQVEKVTVVHMASR